MTAGTGGRRGTLQEVGARMKAEERVLLAVHENPDGDALGSILATGLVMEQLGVAWTGFVPGHEPFPPELSWLPRLSDLVRGELPEPADATLYTLDCASAARFGGEAVRVPFWVNIDHHPDNPLYGDLNLVDAAASSTTQILYSVFRAANLPLNAEIGTCLYVGVVTDTGRFQFSNTTAQAHRMTADLQDLGVDVHEVYRQVYENVPIAKVRLNRRAFENLRLLLDGRLAVSVLSVEDFRQTGAEPSYTEGVIDGIRTIAGVRVAALIREKHTPVGTTELRVSLRSTDGKINVSDIAHTWGGGGHVRAAGYTFHGQTDEAIAELEREVAARQ